MSDLKFILIVFFITILAPFSSDSYLPSLPQMTTYFGTTEAMMQYTITVFFLGLSLAQIFWGPLSDKVGRKKSMLIGCGIAMFGCAISGFATQPWILLLGRFIQGAGAAANASLSRAILRDRFSGKRLAQVGSYVGMLFALTPSVAPIVGGFIESVFDWQANFLFLFLFTGAILLVILTQFEESNKALNNRALHLDQFIQNYMTLLSHKPFMGYILASSAAFSGIIAYYTISPFLLQNQLGLTPFEYGLTALCISGGLLVGQFVNSYFVPKVGIHKMLDISFLLMLVAGAILFVFSSLGVTTVATIVIPTLVFLAGSGIAFSTATAGAFQPFGHIAGAAGAMFGSLQILGTTVASVAVSFFVDTTGMVLALTYLAVSVVGFLGYRKLVNPQPDA